MHGWYYRSSRGSVIGVLRRGRDCVANNKMQIEAGIYVEVVKLEEGGKRTIGKRAKYGLHALRHFCASLWIEANYSAKRVQTYMGHASIVQTYDTYGYLFDLRDNDKEALKRIENRVMSGVDEPRKNVA
jgi:integrase